MIASTASSLPLAPPQVEHYHPPHSSLLSLHMPGHWKRGDTKTDSGGSGGARLLIGEENEASLTPSHAHVKGSMFCAPCIFEQEMEAFLFYCQRGRRVWSFARRRDLIRGPRIHVIDRKNHLLELILQRLQDGPLPIDFGFALKFVRDRLNRHSSRLCIP